jgi:hypothetical protein
MSSFSKQVDAFIAKAQGSARQKVGTICATLHRDIVMDTPVDTGRARANWQASINTPASTASASTDPSGASTVAAGQMAATMAYGNVFWIVNNLPYIASLEFGLYGKPPGSANGPKTVGGYSKQSPRGMVRIAIQNLGRDLR